MSNFITFVFLLLAIGCEVEETKVGEKSDEPIPCDGTATNWPAEDIMHALYVYEDGSAFMWSIYNVVLDRKSSNCVRTDGDYKGLTVPWSCIEPVAGELFADGKCPARKCMFNVSNSGPCPEAYLEDTGETGEIETQPEAKPRTVRKSRPAKAKAPTVEEKDKQISQLAVVHNAQLELIIESESESGYKVEMEFIGKPEPEPDLELEPIAQPVIEDVETPKLQASVPDAAPDINQEPTVHMTEPVVQPASVGIDIAQLKKHKTDIPIAKIEQTVPEDKNQKKVLSVNSDGSTTVQYVDREPAKPAKQVTKPELELVVADLEPPKSSVQPLGPVEIQAEANAIRKATREQLEDGDLAPIGDTYQTMRVVTSVDSEVMVVLPPRGSLDFPVEGPGTVLLEARILYESSASETTEGIIIGTHKGVYRNSLEFRKAQEANAIIEGSTQVPSLTATGKFEVREDDKFLNLLNPSAEGPCLIRLHLIMSTPLEGADRGPQFRTPNYAQMEPAKGKMIVAPEPNWQDVQSGMHRSHDYLVKHVDSLVQNTRADLDMCYLTGMTEAPGLEGRIVVKIVLDTEGNSEVSIPYSNMGGLVGFQTCLSFTFETIDYTDANGVPYEDFVAYVPVDFTAETSPGFFR
ncbi:MAG: hypothetical protein Q8P30_00930 [Candidatus Uhrbacteria bacterium]|nr:hypothetical protein [Candidatus Uhrbacteria bacterium]